MDDIQLKLCDIQGRLFELSYDAGLDSAVFIQTFMRSKLAADLDRSYNRMQWAGEEYLLEELRDISRDELKCGGELYPKEVLYWIGYLYRHWHYLTGESSRVIYRQASAAVMRRNYPMFHTLDSEMAVENFKELYRQKSY